MHKVQTADSLITPKYRGLYRKVPREEIVMRLDGRAARRYLEACCAFGVGLSVGIPKSDLAMFSGVS